MVYYAKIHRKAQNDDVQERKEAVDQICTNFQNLSKKDKEQASKDLLVLTKDEDSDVRWRAAVALSSLFPHLTEKDQAWKDLLALTKDQDSKVQWDAANALGSAFPHLTEKEQEIKELLALSNNQDSIVRRGAAVALSSAFQYLPDKEQAWKDLLTLTNDPDSGVRWRAADALGSVFPHLTEKEQAWKDLLTLTNDPDSGVRWRAADALGSAFPHLTEKNQATKNLLTLTKNSDSGVRRGAADALGSAFPYLTKKEQAWKDLLSLTKDQDSGVRWRAAGALGSVFPHLTEKEQAWKDLLALTKDQDSGVRWSAAGALGSAFQHLTKKEKATKDLLTLTKNQDNDVRSRVANTLGFVFPHLTEKEQAMKDLSALTNDQHNNVRISANHSLGKISIYKATNAGNTKTLQNELEKAIDFFEKASQESIYFNPASFCLPFYQSYYSVIFMQQEAEEEVKKNFKEAKSAVSGSENREKLLEAVENLSSALNEAHKLRDMDDIKADLNGYKRYCDRACELLDSTEGKARGATILIRRGLPIIDERIKELLNEFYNDTKILCDAAKGTEAEKYANPTCKEVTELVKIRNPIELDKRLNGLLPNLKFLVESLPEKEKHFIYDKVENIENEEYLEDKLVLINEIIVFVVPYINMTKMLQDVWGKLDDITVFFDPAIQETITITIGSEILGTGIKRNITIPIREISYSEIRTDLERIKRKCTLNFLPIKLAGKIKDYIESKKNDIIKDLN